MSLNAARWIFLSLVVSLPLVRPFELSIFGLRANLTDFIFLAFIASFASALFRHQVKLHLSKFHLCIALYSIILVIGLITAENLRQSIIKLAAELYLFLLGAAAFELVRQDRKFINRIAAAWSLGTVLTIIATATGFLLFYCGFKTQANNFFLSHFGSLPAGNYPRIHALFANANMMANYLNVSLVFAYLLGDTGFISEWRARWLRAGIWFAAVFTISAGLGGLVLSAGLRLRQSLAAKGKPTAAVGVVLSTAIVCAAVFASTTFAPVSSNTDQRFVVPFTGAVVEPSVRVLIWEQAVQNIAASPVLGKGIGADPVNVRYATLSGSTQILRDAHNSWLSIAAQTGLTGLAAFLVFVFYLISICRFRARPDGSPSTPLFLMTCGFAGAFLYQSLFGSFEDARHLWILFGLLAGLATGENDGEAESTPLSVRPTI